MTIVTIKLMFTRKQLQEIKHTSVQQNIWKKAIAIGDRNLRRINRKLFKESLTNCKASLKYFSGVKTLDLRTLYETNIK